MNQTAINQPIEELVAFLSIPQKIIITMHRDPDADALGSSLGWASYLIRVGHTVTVISPTEYAANLAWLPGMETVLVYEKPVEQRICRQRIKDASLICCLDFSVLSRLKDLGKLVQESSAVKMMIDHHLEPEQFAKWMIWDTNAAATGQLVYALIKQMEVGKVTTEIFDKVSNRQMHFRRDVGMSE